MDDGINGTQGQGAATPASAQTPSQSSATVAPEGFVEVARLNGALKKIQELTLANQSLTDQLAQKDQLIGSLQGDMAQKTATWQAQQSEFTTKLASAETEKSQLNSRLSAFEAMQLKMKIIGELSRPELYSILDVIPDGADEATVRKNVESLANFASTLTQKREQELLAGITNIENNDKTKQTELPTTEEGWQSYVNTLPLGSTERAAAMDAWH